MKSAHALHDTIGCVYFALGDYTKAVTAFELAMTRFAADTTLTSTNWLTSEGDRRQMTKMHTHLQSLYSRRLEAARINAAHIAGGIRAEDPQLQPLTRDLGQALPTTQNPLAPLENAALEKTAGAPGIIP